MLLTKEAEGIQIGTKLLATHIQSLNEAEALQALSVCYHQILHRMLLCNTVSYIIEKIDISIGYQ